MPVYEQTYQHYTGVLRPRTLAWTVIAGSGIKRTVFEKGFRFFLFIALASFFLNIGRIYLAANLELMEWLEIPTHSISQIFTIDAKFYYDFLRGQFIFCFIMTIIAGSDLIAGDKRTKALTLYLSKPISRVDYLFGKGVIVLFYLYAITLFPAWLLMFLQAFFTDNWMYLAQNIPLALKIFLYSNAVVLPLVFLILAFSSTTRAWVTAAAMMGAIYFLPPIVVEILSNILRGDFQSLFGFDTWRSLLSLFSIWDRIGAAIFSVDTEIRLHWVWHLLVLIGLCGLSSLILRRRIKAVEVVK